MTKSTKNFMTTETNATPQILDLSLPLRRRDGGEFEIWEVKYGKIWGRIRAMNDGEWLNNIWQEDGNVYSGAHVTHKWDLLPAPRRIKGWINVYSLRDNTCYDIGEIWTLKELCDLRGKGRVACIYIDVAEGEGLDDQIDK